jgi:Transposase, Mutator family
MSEVSQVRPVRQRGGRRGRVRGPATQACELSPAVEHCPACGHFMRVAYHEQRTVERLDGRWRLRLRVRRCRNAACTRYHQPYRPEEAGAWALPQGEFGLDVIAQIGHWRYREQRSVPQMHQALVAQGVTIAARSVTVLLHRYEELVALRVADAPGLRARLAGHGGVILAMDGLQPDVGHEVLWVLRDCVSGEVLLARSLLGATEDDLAPLLEEVQAALAGEEATAAVPIRGVVTDGQQSLRKAVARVLPGVPHQLCQFHYLREAARPIFEADRHAKVALKKQVRGVRPIERALEGRTDAEAEATRGYCLAVRSALTDDGRPPLAASGLRLHDRLQAVAASLERVEQARAAAGKRGCPSC